MIEYSEKIRAIARRLFTDGTVDMVIGFRPGTIPMMNEPFFATSPADAAALCWDSHCGINLANYLTERKEKIGIVAKGCDSRNIVTHIIENKIRREQLYIIGVPCQGMVDRRKINAMADAVTAVEEKGDALTITTAEGDSQRAAKADVLQNNCTTCVHRNPVIFDELVAETAPEPEIDDRWAAVKKIEALEPEEKWDHCNDVLQDCIRCYACKKACPLCYCPTCFVDESMPQWVGKSQDPIDVRTFHFLRAYHCAGRCTDCGACERACPVGINMRIFTSKLNKDAFELYGWEAGVSEDQRPPLDTYNTDDPDTFIL